MGATGLTLVLAIAPNLPITLPLWFKLSVVLISMAMLSWPLIGRHIASRGSEEHMSSFGMTLMVISLCGLCVGAVLHFFFPSVFVSKADNSPVQVDRPTDKGISKLDVPDGRLVSQTVGQSAQSITNHGPVYNTQLNISSPPASDSKPDNISASTVRLQVSCIFNPRYITRFALVNIGKTDLPYSARILTRPEITVTPGEKANGTVKANTRLEILASDIGTASQSVRATVIFDLVATRGDISGECLVVDMQTGAQQVEPMI